MPEYRALRERYSLLDICRTPDLATEVTLQPIRRIDVDAAILFSDLLAARADGSALRLHQGRGTALERPINDRRTSTACVCSSLARRWARAHRHPADPVGAARPRPADRLRRRPFTLASYAIEGGHSNNFAKTKALMYGHPEAWHRLRKAVADRRRLPGAQIEAGVDAVQVFDSWVGALSAADYREFALPHTRPSFDAVAERCRRSTSARARRRSSRSCARPAAT